MSVILVRYAELGLKSERVRARFTRHLTDNISEDLLNSGVEHIIRTTWGRIFVETDQHSTAMDVLRTIPGVYSMSLVEEVPSDMEGLMDGMAEFARTRLKEGMSFGIKVKRTGDTDYSSRDVAIAGGDAVCRHLDDTRVSVDLKDPDIWFEVEIRGDRAYLFTERVKGPGGMPYDTQGKVVLYLPDLHAPDRAEEIMDRGALSYLMMRRRGCRVIHALSGKSEDVWKEHIERITRGEGRPFVIGDGDLAEELSSAVRKTGAFGLAHPGSEKNTGQVPILHADGTPLSVFQPTIGLTWPEVKGWIRRLS